MVATRYGRIAALVALCCLTMPAVAADVKALRKGIAHEALFAVAFDGGRGLAGGAGGQLLVTDDGGKTWKPETSPTPLGIMAVAIRGQRRLIAAQMGQIFADDGSGEWVKADSGSSERAMGVAINADGVALVVGAFGMFARSTDGGRNWSPVTVDWDVLFADAVDLGPGFQPQLYDVQIDDHGVALVVGEFRTIVRSTDAGASWTPVLSGDVQGGERPPTLFGLSLRSDGVAYAVGQTGTLLRSPDTGLTWSALNSGTDANLFDVVSVPGGKTVASGMREMRYAGSDTGRWEALEGEDLSVAWYSGMAYSEAGGVIAVGQSGNILQLTR